jgi:hypothetical protein
VTIGGGVIRSRRRMLTLTECRMRFGREFRPDNEGTRKLAAAIATARRRQIPVL